MTTYRTALTHKQLAAAKPKDKDYVLSDGGGLQLRVCSNGSKLWNFNYRHPVTKKRVNMGVRGDKSFLESLRASAYGRDLGSC